MTNHLAGQTVILSVLPRVAAHQEYVEFAITKEELLDMSKSDSKEWESDGGSIKTVFLSITEEPLNSF